MADEIDGAIEKSGSYATFDVEATLPTVDGQSRKALMKIPMDLTDEGAMRLVRAICEIRDQAAARREQAKIVRLPTIVDLSGKRLT